MKTYTTPTIYILVLVTIILTACNQSRNNRWVQYINEVTGVSILHPQEWVRTETEDGFCLATDPRNTENICITYIAPSEPELVDKLIDKMIYTIQPPFQRSDLIMSIDIPNGSIHCFSMTYTQETHLLDAPKALQEASYDIVLKSWVVDYNNSIITVGQTTVYDNSADHQERIQQVLDSIVFHRDQRLPSC